MSRATQYIIIPRHPFSKKLCSRYVLDRNDRIFHLGVSACSYQSWISCYTYFRGATWTGERQLCLRPPGTPRTPDQHPEDITACPERVRTDQRAKRRGLEVQSVPHGVSLARPCLVQTALQSHSSHLQYMFAFKCGTRVK